MLVEVDVLVEIDVLVELEELLLVEELVEVLVLVDVLCEVLVLVDELSDVLVEVEVLTDELVLVEEETLDDVLVDVDSELDVEVELALVVSTATARLKLSVDVALPAGVPIQKRNKGVVKPRAKKLILLLLSSPHSTPDYRASVPRSFNRRHRRLPEGVRQYQIPRHSTSASQRAVHDATVICENSPMMFAVVVAVEKRRGVGLSATAPVKRIV